MSNYEFSKNTLFHLHQDIALTPQDHVSIDLLGPYNVTSQDNSYTLTAVCYLTGYLMSTPIKDKKKMTVANHLFSDIMLKFGFPRILHSDNGMEFKSNSWKIFPATWYKKSYISPHHPQANRKFESLHRFIKDCINKLSEDGGLE